MNRILLIIPVLLFVTDCVAKNNEEFKKFALRQDSLMHAAYEARNTRWYEQELHTFELEYAKLKKEDKEDIRRIYSSGYYNLSCTYALLGNKGKAIQHLKNSWDVGFHDYYHIISDTDLDTLRREEGYLEFIDQIKKIGDYTYILKRGKEYDHDEKHAVPVFTYQYADDSNLVTLRKTYDLDSVAGNANEVSKIINLMRWVHNMVPHDGSSGLTDARNAHNMITICQKEGRGVNCRGLATILNECYLAMGFPSRLVTCLPKDSLGEDNDCHVINMVYSKMLKKWIWMDPSFEAYVMNEKGELLGIPEVRERLIEGKPLILNPDANWNHKSSQTVEDYLEYYMTKNLYWFSCPLHSKYNLEANEKGKRRVYVELLPLDYFDQGPEKDEKYYDKQDVTYVKYKTNNDKKFWAAP